MSDTDTYQDPSFLAQCAILEAALPIAAFEGWTDKTLRLACANAGLPEGAQALYFPAGPLELIVFWNARCNEDAVEALASMDLASLKIRQRVTQSVLARLMAIGPHEEAARRALAKLSIPTSAAAGPKTLWANADSIWRAIGDTSTDANYYSKRGVLSAVIASTLPVWLGDFSDDKAEARAFLDRRIENVMQFETFKAKARKTASNLPDPIRTLSQLRYGRAPARRR